MKYWLNTWGSSILSQKSFPISASIKRDCWLLQTSKINAASMGVNRFNNYKRATLIKVTLIGGTYSEFYLYLLNNSGTTIKLTSKTIIIIHLYSHKYLIIAIVAFTSCPIYS